MNTRLQVEHPVTEAITGLDLVEWQFRVAAGEPLPLAQERGAARRPRGRGAALCRGSGARLPAVDRHAAWRCELPAGDGVRVDTGVEAGRRRSRPIYDPMIAKMIAHAPTREAALDRLAGALERTHRRRPAHQCRVPRRALPCARVPRRAIRHRLHRAQSRGARRGAAGSTAPRRRAASRTLLAQRRGADRAEPIATPRCRRRRGTRPTASSSPGARALGVADRWSTASRSRRQVTLSARAAPASLWMASAAAVMRGRSRRQMRIYVLRARPADRGAARGDPGSAMLEHRPTATAR